MKLKKVLLSTALSLAVIACFAFKNGSKKIASYEFGTFNYENSCSSGGVNEWQACSPTNTGTQCTITDEGTNYPAYELSTIGQQYNCLYALRMPGE